MKNKKGKKLSLHKIKIAKLNQNGLRSIIGGDTEIGVDFSATNCNTDTCPDPTVTCPTDYTCDITGCVNASNICRTDERFCGYKPVNG
ncbi:class I lanthipeptide [uncultured Aquimarina sp.]|uniref:class I lanthipeptide n=1 Tax=uncultured Aquimarina sp. TaxID=575652 RepID=UPI00260A7EC9|nr:class I lanthipeptide [uncultured Aquimarina sp.]